MRLARGPWRPVRFGVALGADRLYAVRLERVRGLARAPDEPWTRILGPLPAAGAEWPALGAALRELAGESGGSARALHLVLLPPLINARALELPRLRDGDARAIVTRSTARYFPGMLEPQVVGLARMSASRERVTYLVATVAERALQAVFGAAENAGWRVASIAPAHSAWAAAAAAGRRPRGAALRVIAATAGRVEVMEVAGGRPLSLRRLPWRPEEPEPLVAAAREILPDAGDGASVCVFAPASLRAAWAAAAGACELEDPPTPSAEAVAAAFAAVRPRPALLPGSVSRRNAQRARAAVLRATAASVVCLVLAAGFRLRGLQHQVAVVQAERARIAPATRLAMLVHDSLAQAAARGDAVAAVRHTIPLWSRVVIELARRLPEDAYIVSLRAEGDSLLLDGRGAHAADVLAALGASPLLADVRLSAPVLREQRDSTEDPAERFQIAARLVVTPTEVRP